MIESDLIKISEWFKNNLLVLNADKTKIIYYNTHQKVLNTIPDFFINNSKIERIENMKYLGLIIDSNLNWNPHVEHIMKKIRPYVGVFRRIAFICSDKVKKMMYYAYFHSNIIYLLTIWSGTKKENIKKIKVLQNKCLRNLFYNKYIIGNIKTEDIYKEHDIIDFEHLIDFELKTNFHKIIKKDLKSDIKIFKKNKIHKHETRQAKKFYKIKSNNKFGALSIINRGIDAYDTLLTPLKKTDNNNTFKRNLKKYILEEQTKEYESKISKKKNKKIKRLK